MNKKILYFIEQVGSLMQFKRLHHRSLGTTFDTVSSHSHHVAVIAYCVCRMEGLSHEEGLEGMAMGVLHDVAEARTSDLDYVSKHYASVDEEKVVHDQFSGFEFGEDLKKVVEKYEERSSLVAKCAKDADSLAQVFHEWALMWQGNKLAEQWFEGDFTNRLPHLRTESAKQLMLSMKESNPNEWWWSEFIEKGISSDFLNSKK